MANWSELHQDIVGIVLKKLVDIEDIARFSCVCKPWNSVAIYHKKQLFNLGCAPWLMLTKRANDQMCNNNGRIRSCYSLSNKRLFNLFLPEAQRRRCWGTTYGWLFTVGIDLNIHLLHPITRVQISLPPQPTFPNQFDCRVRPQLLCCTFTRKFALASNPSLWSTNTATIESSSTLVVAIYRDRYMLAVASPGDKAWRSVLEECKDNEDIIFFNGHFYVISLNGTLLLCEDLNTTQPKATLIASPPGDEDLNFVYRLYLIDLSGELHLVVRHYDTINDEDGSDLRDFYYETKWFCVYKLDFLTKKWIEVEDLGDHALFIGNNTSFSISTSKFPEFKGSCIYFTDDHVEVYDHRLCDMGVYHIKADTIETFYVDNDKLSKFSRPFFYMPTFD